MYEEYLAHYGVKGMKWRVRKHVPNKSSFVDWQTQKMYNRAYEARNKSAKEQEEYKLKNHLTSGPARKTVIFKSNQLARSAKNTKEYKLAKAKNFVEGLFKKKKSKRF